MTIVRGLILFMLITSTTMAAPVAFQSSEKQTSLLELYTSEGCSSCPPAEDWLSGLKDSPGLWKDFVPVAFHVDYWNHLGWRDPWSDAQFSARQSDYAKTWGTDNIYTPEFILNGKEWRYGLWQQGVPAASGSHAGVLKASSDDARHWHITYTPSQKQESKYEVHAALIVSGVSSDVKAGENSGRQLKHDFIAVAFNSAPLVNSSNVLASEFTFDAAQNKSGGRLALAAWVSPQGKSEPLQAAGGWLKP